jgi:hypothetical protein
VVAKPRSRGHARVMIGRMGAVRVQLTTPAEPLLSAGRLQSMRYLIAAIMAAVVIGAGLHFHGWAYAMLAAHIPARRDDLYNYL